MMEKGVKQPDNRWRHDKKTDRPTSDKEKAEAIAVKLLGRQKTSVSSTERWTTVVNWRGLYGIAITFENEVFVFEKPTQNIYDDPTVSKDEKVLHRVNFDPPNNPNGKIASISARDLRSKDDGQRMIRF